MPGVGSPIVASCLARALSAPPFAVSSLDVIAASPIQPCRCPWNASSWTEPARRPKSIVCPGAQFRKDLRHPQKPSSGRRLRRGQRFFRNWAQQGDAEAGAWEQDAIRNITGTAGSFKAIPGSNRFSGAFTKLVSTGGSDDSAATGPAALSFDASLVVHTGPQNVPQHVWQPLVIYLGRSSQV